MNCSGCTPNGRLIKGFESYDGSTIIDFSLIVAWNIETAFLESGMKPGLDYTALDIMKLAFQIAAEKDKDYVTPGTVVGVPRD